MLWSKVVTTAFLQEMRRIKSYFLVRSSSTAMQILIGPQELRTTDATIADDIFTGRLTFAGRHIDVNTDGSNFHSIFDAVPPTQAFAKELHGFAWLRHIRAFNQASRRVAARILIDDWINTYGQNASGFAMRPSVLSRRLISFISQAPVLLDEAEPEFYHNFMSSLSFQASILDRELKLGLPHLDRLTAWIALNYFAQCSNVSLKFLSNVEKGLLRSLSIEILPDGGHVSRNPQIVLDLVLDLLPLQQVFAARGRAIPELIPDVIGKMLTMLRLLRHSDGSIGAFNGMSVTEAGLLARVLPYLGASNIPLFDASYSGYQRLEKNKSVLLVDAGRVPPPKYSLLAHAGCLSFEFSSGLNRLIVNCGTPVSGSKTQSNAARQTAAHSVLTINNISSSQFSDSSTLEKNIESVTIEGPSHLTYGRQIIEDGDMLVARHDGYLHNFGLMYQRSFWLNETGLRLEGQDMLQAAQDEVGRSLKTKITRMNQPKKKIMPSNMPFALRFHLHPLVNPKLNADKTVVMLELPDKEIWKFSVSGYLIEIESSIYFATAQGQQKTSQIVISGRASINTKVDWILEHVPFQ